MRISKMISPLRSFLGHRQGQGHMRNGVESHIQNIQEIFDGHNVPEITTPVFDHPLICLGFTNRSGSNLLASYLRDLPPFSGFHEDLLPSTLRSHAARLKTTSLADTLRVLSENRTQDQSIYGFKASVEQILMLQHFGIPKLYKGGLKIIESRRDDIVGQAISYQIAVQTGRWTSRIRPEKSVTAACDPEQIEHLIAGIRRSQTLMDLMVERDAIARLILRYEDVAEAPAAAVEKVAQFCGFDPTGWETKPPRIQRQADATNAEFRAAFRDYLTASDLTRF